MKIEKLPKKFEPIWEKCLGIFKEGRPGDMEHAKSTVEFILDYQGSLKMDLDILIPVAMMHDIGHAYILPEHFAFLTGGKKVKNGKLTHMLTGAKIAHDILTAVGYDQDQNKEIIEIIATHDADQIEGWNSDEYYNTENKRIFSDIDKLDRFTQQRIDAFKKLFEGDQLKKAISDSLNVLFFEEFKELASKRLRELKF